MKPGKSFAIGAWAPSLILALVPIYVVGRSLLARDHFAQAAYAAHDTALTSLSTGCWAIAILLCCFSSLRRIAVEHLERLGGEPLLSQRLWVATAFASVASWFAFVRYCQYRICLLPADTANAVHMSHNFLHHRSLTGTALENPMLSIHFNLLLPLLSPVLLLGGPAALILTETILLASAPIAAYCLAFALTSSSYIGTCALLLALSSPFLYELLTASLNFNALAAFLPWAVLFWQNRRWSLFAAAALLILSSGEQVPLICFGLGFYTVAALGFAKPRSWAIGLGLCALSLALWWAELAVIAVYARETGIPVGLKSGIFKSLVPPETPLDQILPQILTHPWRSLQAAIPSPTVLWPTARLLIFSGFLPLLAPEVFIVLLCTVAPHILAGTRPLDISLKIPLDVSFSNLGLHYSAPVLGVLFWASCMGLKRLNGWLKPRGLEGCILIGILAVAGLGFRFANRTLRPNWRPKWTLALPKILAHIPPEASVWADEYATPHLATRRHLALVGWGPTEPAIGYQRLFKPDYVLLDSSFILLAKLPYRDRLLTFLGRNKFEKIAEVPTLFLLRAPNLSKPTAPAELTTLPPPDRTLANSYALYLMKRLDGQGPVAEEFLEDFHSRGLLLAAQGRWEEAIRLYRDTLVLNPDYHIVRCNMGVALASLGRMKDAERHLKEAARLNPAHPDIRLNYANFLAAEGRLDEALAQYREALRLNPGHPGLKERAAQVERALRPRP